MISVLYVTVCLTLGQPCEPAQPLTTFYGPEADSQCQSQLSEANALIKRQKVKARVLLECDTEPGEDSEQPAGQVLKQSFRF